ncbi:hypothetical protein B566_EDAN013779 [Ephemera danica]|nr:hypothetical protein B566_EDAN013779 [Ephemera danica]
MRVRRLISVDGERRWGVRWTMSWNTQGLIEDAVGSSTRAVQFDSAGQFDVASYFYREAARLLLLAAKSGDPQGLQAQGFQDKAKEYLERADTLDKQKMAASKQASQTEDQRGLCRVRFFFHQALDADETGDEVHAVELYMKAVELSIHTNKITNDVKLQQKLTNLAKQALERAEVLKGISSDVKQTAIPNPPSQSAPVTTSQRPQLHRGSSAHLVVSGQASYTKEEKLVLERTSRINNNEFVPFMSVDLREQFRLTMPYTDRTGFLALSPKQAKNFARWARPEEICSEPVMVAPGGVDCWSIKQTVISDCSFVASLAISSLYERRFNKRIVTSIIYPCNSKNEPVYNPFGKYMMKFHINGVARKVVIDDFLPVGKHGELLCSYSTNKNELWISLIEKAYMKVMGGYDFPGSNSNIDLHALTGWIPERAAIRPEEGTFNKNSFFSMLGIKLLKLKNPWSHLRWRGNYSELDTRHWTEELKSILKFDPNSAAMFDNGVFWIDLDSICQFFEVFYLNWNPGLFKYTFCLHQCVWTILVVANHGTGPIKDAYNVGDNPQFSLEVPASPSPASVWILLTRHITQIEDFKENREYITVVVYKNNGQKVYYPYEPKPYIDGIRINSPHYLVKMSVPANTTERYTLVVSQYEKTNTIYYTIRAYSTNPFTMKKIGNLYESGFVYLELSSIPAGTYDVIVSTFLPHQEAPFILTVKCSNAFSLS